MGQFQEFLLVNGRLQEGAALARRGEDSFRENLLELRDEPSGELSLPVVACDGQEFQKLSQIVDFKWAVNLLVRLYELQDFVEAAFFPELVEVVNQEIHFAQFLGRSGQVMPLLIRSFFSSELSVN